MSQDAETLGGYLGLDNEAAAKRAATALAQSEELKRASGLPAALRSPAAKALIWSMKAMLTDPVSKTMLTAWSRYKEVRDLLTAPPDKANDLALRAHDIALARRPALELVLNGAPTGLQFEFELQIGLVIESAVLTVQNRRITAARLGKVHGEGHVNCGRATIIERKTGAVKLPARLAFNPGFPITDA